MSHLRSRALGCLYSFSLLAATFAQAGCEVGTSIAARPATGAAAASGGSGGGTAGGTPGDANSATGTDGTAPGPGNGNASVVPSPPGGPTTPGTTFDVTNFTRGYAYRGRFDFADPAGPRYAWPNSAIGATFTGTSLAIKLAEPVPTLYNLAPVNNTYDVFVDQRPRQLIAATPGAATYPVVDGLTPGTHTMWLSKRTEANIGRGQFSGVVLSADGKLLSPPALRAHQLEFIGDSSSSGYGNDGNFPAWNGCTFSVATADSSVAYPQVTAELLAAEFQNIAFSGKGITRNLADVDALTMPTIYPLWDPRDTAAAYTFPGPVAEVTVINVGGNDWTGDGTVGTPPDLAAFTQGYIKLLQSVRSHSPKTSIFVAVTPLAHGQDRVTYVQYVKSMIVTALAQGITDLQYFEFAEYFGALGYGCDGHPSPAASAQMAQQLAAAIKKAKGW